MITSENGLEWYPVLKYGLYKNNGSGHLGQIGQNFDSVEEALKEIAEMWSLVFEEVMIIPYTQWETR